MSADDEIAEPLKDFVSRFFKGYALEADEDLFSLGYVNSMFAMQLVQFIESRFGIVVEDEDLDLENFRSLSAIAIFVSRKRA